MYKNCAVLFAGYAFAKGVLKGKIFELRNGSLDKRSRGTCRLYGHGTYSSFSQ